MSRLETQHCENSLCFFYQLIRKPTLRFRDRHTLHNIGKQVWGYIYILCNFRIFLFFFTRMRYGAAELVWQFLKAIFATWRGYVFKMFIFENTWEKNICYMHSSYGTLKFTKTIVGYSLLKVFWTCESTKSVWIALLFSPHSVFHCHFISLHLQRLNCTSFLFAFSVSLSFHFSSPMCFIVISFLSAFSVSLSFHFFPPSVF